MEMDRQTLFAIFGAIITLTLIGTTYLGTPSRDLDRPVYAEGDIRAKVQKDEEKQSRKGARSRAIPTQESSPGYAESDAEEPPAEEPSAEEPSIE